MSKCQIATVLIVMTLMGRMGTFVTMKMLLLHFSEKCNSVVNSFSNLVYLDPCVASLHSAPEYNFIRPNWVQTAFTRMLKS